VSRGMIRALILVPVLLLVLVTLFFALRPDSSTSGSAAADEQQEKTIDLVIEKGIMTPDEITVDEGDRVEFRITSDSPLEFHLHGYDLEEEIESDELAELSFDATITGRFEIENEQTREELGVLIVQPR
jgi:plastocyanin